jgi:solute carrier family 34 (sodium-dependent phosphate cotransporter)
MAASVQDKVESLQVALAHLFFNVTGIIIWYPLPFMRAIPLRLARERGKATRIWRGFPLVYVVCFFFIFPLILLGISSLFQKKTPGHTALGSFLVIVVGLILLYSAFWWRFRDGKGKFNSWMSRREKQRVTMKDLPENMDKLLELPMIVEHLQGEIAMLLERREGLSSEEQLKHDRGDKNEDINLDDTAHDDSGRELQV